MANHINTAIKALEKQVVKFQLISKSEYDKSIAHAKTSEYYAKEANKLYEQVLTLKNESVEEKQPV